MANVKNRAGTVRNAAGVALVGKTATLKNHVTDAALAAATTDAQGKWSFTGLDETIRHRVEVAFGGGSAQIQVTSPSSPEFDDAYIYGSLRTAAAATVSFGGPVSVGGALTVTGASNLNGGVGVTGSSTLNGPVSVGGALAQSGGYAYLGSWNTGTSLYPRAGTDLGVGWNFASGSREMSLWNTDTGNTTGISFAFRQLTGASTRRDLLTIASSGAVTIPSGALAVTGVVTAGFGSAGAPGFAFVGDENTGLFRNNEGNISMVSNGTIRLSTTGTGVDIIGNTTVNGSLTAGATGFSGVMTVSSAAFLNNNLTVGGDMSVSGGLTLNNGLTIPTGNVGISNALTVGGALTLNNQARFGSGIATASAVLGVVRTLRVYDAVGNPLGYIPIYSGFNG